MLVRTVSLLALCSCQERAPAPGGASATAAMTIELRDGDGAVQATVVPGHPCRATVEGTEVLVGGRPLVAQIGTTKWTGEDAENGTTIRENGELAARIHARQLFDGAGIPLVRVSENGDIVNGAGQVVRHAAVADNGVVITRAVNPGQPAGERMTVTNTTDVVLAAMLSAREATAEIRALAACNFLLSNEPRVH